MAITVTVYQIPLCGNFNPMLAAEFVTRLVHGKAMILLFGKMSLLILPKNVLHSPSWIQLGAPLLSKLKYSHLPRIVLDYICCQYNYWSFPFSKCSVQFSRSVVSNSLRPYGLQHTRPSCPSPTPGVHSNSCPVSRWCHPTISSSVIPFSFHLQSFPASGSFPMSQLFTSGGHSIGVSASASVLPVNIQDWFPLGWTGWISL